MKSCDNCIFKMVAALDSDPCYSCSNLDKWEPEKYELRSRLKDSEAQIAQLRADLAARDAEIKAVLEAVRDGSANPDRTMTVLGLENAVAAIHKFALYELKKHEGAKS